VGYPFSQTTIAPGIGFPVKFIRPDDDPGGEAIQHIQQQIGSIQQPKEETHPHHLAREMPFYS